MPLSAHDMLGHYEILALLGAGGMGEVYRARDTQLGREVAIKVLPPAMAQDGERLARFDREAKVLAALNHPNIASIYGLIESQGQRALIMELVPGEMLSARIKRGALPVEEACKIALQIAEAVEAAHEKGVVHRDLKPGNVMLTPAGVVKVLDFGLAAMHTVQQPASDAENAPTLTMSIGAMTQAGAIMGTAGYMSPEQAIGTGADRRADIWAYGVVFWEMLAGKRLFRGDTVSHTLAAVLQGPIDFGVVNAPEPIRGLIRRCLDRDLKSRLQWIGEARVALQTFLANPITPIPGVTPVRSSYLAWGVAAALLLTTLAVGFVHFRETPASPLTQRYTLPLPPSASLHSLAVSPDGRFLVMAATDAGGKRQLWLRSMNSLQLEPMTSTDGGMYPFWSPDSHFIAFFADGKLKRVAASGGPSQTICAAIDGRSGSWNREDIIVFAPTGATKGVLQRVSAGGGTPTDVAKVSGVAKHPVFLPDGRRFLYSVTDRAQPERGGIYLGSLEGGTLNGDRRLLTDVADPVFVSPRAGTNLGYILFIRENTLMAQPFDAESAQLAGDAFPVAENVAVTTNNSYVPATVSDTGLLLYSAATQIETTMISWFDRAGSRLGDVGPGSGPVISPNQKTLAFWRGGPGGSDIWLRDVERGIDRRFTTDPANDTQPVWSPDGSRLAFFSLRSSPFPVFQKAASGSEPETLLWASAMASAPSQWTRAGIVYGAGEGIANNGLYLFPVDEGATAKPRVLLETQFNERHVQLSPDSNWMAYASDESGRFEVYVRPYPVAEGVWRISTMGGTQPRWKGDSKELVYRAEDGTLTAVAIKAVVSGSRKAIEPGPPVPLFKVVLTPSGTTYQYDMTADAKRFLISTIPSGVIRPPLTVVVNWDPARP